MRSSKTGTSRPDLLSRLVANRPARRTAVAAVHVVLWSFGFAAALMLRYEGDVPAAMRAHCLPLLAVLVVARLGAFHSLRLFDGLFRYVGLGELRRIVAASAAATLVALGARALFAPLAPRSILFVELLASIAVVGGVRLLIRMAYERRPSGKARTRTLVIGANDSGESLVRELSRGDRSFQVIGFLDEDPARVGSDVHEVPVLGLADEKTLREVVVGRNVQEVVFAMPDVASGSMRQLVVRARSLGARTLVVPSLAERLAAPAEVLRDIVLEDLLGRDPVCLDHRQLDAFLRDKVVLVTGAGGSIGSELCPPGAPLRPARAAPPRSRRERALLHRARAARRLPGGDAARDHRRHHRRARGRRRLRPAWATSRPARRRAQARAADGAQRLRGGQEQRLRHAGAGGGCARSRAPRPSSSSPPTRRSTRPR